MYRQRRIQPHALHALCDGLSKLSSYPFNAPYFDGARLLVAAYCTAFVYGNFHNDFMKNHVTLIGCPKLDAEDYSVKLTEIIT